MNNVNGDKGDWGLSMESYAAMRSALLSSPDLDKMNRVMIQNTIFESTATNKSRSWYGIGMEQAPELDLAKKILRAIKLGIHCDSRQHCAGGNLDASTCILTFWSTQWHPKRTGLSCDQDNRQRIGSMPWYHFTKDQLSSSDFYISGSSPLSINGYFDPLCDAGYGIKRSISSEKRLHDLDAKLYHPCWFYCIGDWHGGV